MPDKPCLAILTLSLEDEADAVLHRNFTAFLVGDGPASRQETIQRDGAQVRLLRFAPSSFTAAQWSLKQWNVLDGLKVNGAGHGYFEYRLPWPEGVDAATVQGASLVFEASAKQLFGKDREGAARQEGDFMLGKGTHDPSRNPNSYPMTDTVRFPTAVRVRVAASPPVSSTCPTTRRIIGASFPGTPNCEIASCVRRAPTATSCRPRFRPALCARPPRPRRSSFDSRWTPRSPAAWPCTANGSAAIRSIRRSCCT